MRQLLILLAFVMVSGCGQGLAPTSDTSHAISSEAARSTPLVDVVNEASRSSMTAEAASTTVIPTVTRQATMKPTTEPTPTVTYYPTPMPTDLPTATIPPTAVVPTPPPGGLPQARIAPPITDDVWLNSEPLVVSDLGKEGKVTLVEFWTYSCYNCLNVLPHLQTWHETYADQGLTIIGVHYPEFSYERDVDNVRQALTDLKIKFPVTIDNDGTTWRAYGQRYWPTMYLIDKTGQIRYLRIGEGGYETTEQWIQCLLAEQL